MEFRGINRIKNREHKDFKKLYYSVFPKDERRPWVLLMTLIKKDKIKAFSIYDRDDFIGILVYSSFEDILWIDYLATSEDVRGNGYGHKILDILQQEHFGNRFFVEVETPDPNSEEYENQLKRISFYEHNGYSNTGVRANVFNCDFTLYSKGGTITFEDYENITVNSYGIVFFKMANYRKIEIETE